MTSQALGSWRHGLLSLHEITIQRIRSRGLKLRDLLLFMGLVVMTVMRHRWSFLHLLFLSYLPLEMVYRVAAKSWRRRQRQQC